MTSDDLTKSQAKAIREALFPGMNYLVRLKKRMEKAGFPGDDKLCQLVCAAWEDDRGQTRVFFDANRRSTAAGWTPKRQSELRQIWRWAFGGQARLCTLRPQLRWRQNAITVINH